MSSESWIRRDQFDRSLAPTIATDRGLKSRFRLCRDRPRFPLPAPVGSGVVLPGPVLPGSVLPGSVLPEAGLT
jgi:hypothetical protein